MTRKSTQALLRVGVLLLLLTSWLVIGKTLNRANGASEFVRHFGVLSIIYGDPPPNSSTAPQTYYFLTQDSGATLRLVFDDAAQASRPWSPLGGRRVMVVGRAMSNGNLQVIELALEPRNDDAISPLAGSQPFVTILCLFNDVATQPRSLDYFQNMYANAYPGLEHYWQESSYGNVSLNGSTAVGYYTLPEPRSHYVPSGGAPDFDALTADCTAAADADVDFQAFAGFNLVFSASLDCCAYGGLTPMTLDGVRRTWRVTWLPAWAIRDISVVAHEMGHSFGLPHSSGDYGAVYDNPWDVMSGSQIDCYKALHLVYGCIPQGLIAFHKDWLGWIASDRIYNFTDGPQTITLERLALPASDGYLLAQIPIFGSTTRYYTLEARQQVGYDRRLPGQGVIIHEVNTRRSERAHVVDSDGNGDNRDAGAIWVPGETFVGLDGVTVTFERTTATGYIVTISQALPTATPTSTETPAAIPSPSRTLTVTPSGTPAATTTRAPSRTPSVTPTIKPTKTPRPTRTKAPTATPTIRLTKTPRPTRTKAPTSTPLPTLQATPSATITLRPTSDSHTTATPPPNRPYRIYFPAIIE